MAVRAHFPSDSGWPHALSPPLEQQPATRLAYGSREPRDVAHGSKGEGSTCPARCRRRAGNATPPATKATEAAAKLVRTAR
mmetsp:Transcript_28947/g.39121  ORF Transcript_28947/g.39121 Transcript_28947/m.39121 type:complete len:81 (-) Transcript_28947:446-688(-)